MTLRKIGEDHWSWSTSNHVTMLLMHRGTLIHECSWNEWLMLAKISANEPFILGPRGETRQYCIYRNTLYTCPTDWRPHDVLERIKFPGDEDQLQHIKRMTSDAHDRMMKSAAAYQRQADKSLKEAMSSLYPTRSRYIPNRSKIAAATRTNGMCFYCRERPAEHFDHFIPFSKGGSNEPNNIVGSCSPCNLKKTDKMPGEWEGRA